MKDQIDDIMNWYSSLPEDYAGINDLMYSRQQLVALRYQTSIEVGNARKSFNLAQARSETNKYKLEVQYHPHGVGKAKAMARANNGPLLEAEKKAEGEYYAIRYIVESVDEVLSAMNQQIALLRREQEQSKYTGS